MSAHLNNQSLCLGFDGGGKKVIQQYWWEKQDAHTKHTKKCGDITAKDSFSFSSILAWVEVN